VQFDEVKKWGGGGSRQYFCNQHAGIKFSVPKKVQHSIPMIEKNIENLIGPHAAKKIKKMAEHIRSCTMMTALDKRPVSCRPMGIQKADDKARIYFFSHKNSDKNKELRRSAEMQLIINNDKDAEYISLYGYAEVVSRSATN
jgi:pyridoxine/pyridoxamine 5'-phosphate oxidase